ncbi:hypothetical protein PAHAL_2G424100 [Panicum hallii]|uniref:Uncharacterized protein n=1 Tax=Panicum hallii TaxID=206008 RepID=A0A2S3H3W5_9POAL|nr:hypothetical protein PAHAL_2G424100 [Panicum hallii]
MTPSHPMLTPNQALSLGVVDHLIAFFPPRKFGAASGSLHPPLSLPSLVMLSLIVVFDPVGNGVYRTMRICPVRRTLVCTT